MLNQITNTSEIVAIVLRLVAADNPRSCDYLRKHGDNLLLGAAVLIVLVQQVVREHGKTERRWTSWIR